MLSGVSKAQMIWPSAISRHKRVLLVATKSFSKQNRGIVAAAPVSLRHLTSPVKLSKTALVPSCPKTARPSWRGITNKMGPYSFVCQHLFVVTRSNPKIISLLNKVQVFSKRKVRFAGNPVFICQSKEKPSSKSLTFLERFTLLQLPFSISLTF